MFDNEVTEVMNYYLDIETTGQDFESDGEKKF